MILYSYGGFTLHDNGIYFTQENNLSWVAVNVTTAKVVRRPGVRKMGDTVDMRTITLPIGILAPDGTRLGLERAIDQMSIALNKRQQNMVIHADGRYFIADCVNVDIPVKHPAWAVAQVTFNCYQPFARAAQARTQTITQQLVGTSPYTLTVTLGAGGTVSALPTLTITNNSVTAITGLTINNVTTGQQLTVNSLTLNQTDFVTINCDPDSTNGQTIYKNGNNNTLLDFSGTFPNMPPDGSTWQVQCTSASAPNITVVWTWTPLHLN